jgi:hypothetical protein
MKERIGAKYLYPSGEFKEFISSKTRAKHQKKSHRITIFPMDLRLVFKIHAINARYNGHGQYQNRNDGKDLHHLV